MANFAEQLLAGATSQENYDKQLIALISTLYMRGLSNNSSWSTESLLYRHPCFGGVARASKFAMDDKDPTYDPAVESEYDGYGEQEYVTEAGLEFSESKEAEQAAKDNLIRLLNCAAETGHIIESGHRVYELVFKEGKLFEKIEPKERQDFATRFWTVIWQLGTKAFEGFLLQEISGNGLAIKTLSYHSDSVCMRFIKYGIKAGLIIESGYISTRLTPGLKNTLFRLDSAVLDQMRTTKNHQVSTAPNTEQHDDLAEVIKYLGEKKAETGWVHTDLWGKKRPFVLESEAHAFISKCQTLALVRREGETPEDVIIWRFIPSLVAKHLGAKQMAIAPKPGQKTGLDRHTTDQLLDEINCEVRFAAVATHQSKTKQPPTKVEENEIMPDYTVMPRRLNYLKETFPDGYNLQLIKGKLGTEGCEFADYKALDNFFRRNMPALLEKGTVVKIADTSPDMYKVADEVPATEVDATKEDAAKPKAIMHPRGDNENRMVWLEKTFPNGFTRNDVGPYTGKEDCPFPGLVAYDNMTGHPSKAFKERFDEVRGSGLLKFVPKAKPPTSDVLPIELPPVPDNVAPAPELSEHHEAEMAALLQRATDAEQKLQQTAAAHQQELEDLRSDFAKQIQALEDRATTLSERNNALKQGQENIISEQRGVIKGLQGEKTALTARIEQAEAAQARAELEARTSAQAHAQLTEQLATAEAKLRDAEEQVQGYQPIAAPIIGVTRWGLACFNAARNLKL